MTYNSFIPRFKSNNWDSGLGFQIEYESSDVTQWSYNRGTCGGNFTTQNGILTSPSYPHNYPDDVDCVYRISQPSSTVIVLTFHSMDIYSYGFESICYEYLEIRDGSSVASPLFGKLCGTEFPAPIQSSQNQMWLK